MAAYGAALASTKASSSQHHATPNMTNDQQGTAPPEPRALRDWKWREDAEAANNPCHKGDGRGGTGYVNLRKDDLVWTGQCPGTPPRPRSDGIPWRFGLNLQQQNLDGSHATLQLSLQNNSPPQIKKARNGCHHNHAPNISEPQIRTVSRRVGGTLCDRHR